ncbi:hypothetical protein OY671_013077, partial [Metschnikowia pulcherrima]
GVGTPVGQPIAADHRRHGGRGARYPSPDFGQRLLRGPEGGSGAARPRFPRGTHSQVPGIFRAGAGRSRRVAGGRQASELCRPVVVPSGRRPAVRLSQAHGHAGDEVSQGHGLASARRGTAGVAGVFRQRQAPAIRRGHIPPLS